MSLRNVHLVFIVCAIALALYLFAWSFNGYRAGGGMSQALICLASAVSAAALVAWERAFLRRVQ